MNYQSTRNAALTASSAEAILNGLAPDGGLYAMPALSGLDFDWQRCLTLSTQGMATEILCALLPDFTHAEMEQLVHAAYTGKFETEDLTPTVPVGEDTVLELFRGPTSAFKDVALSMLPHLMTAAKKKCGVDDEILILTATSGDTGKAAMEGFCDVAGTKIIVFYPDGGVSAVQKVQMVTQGGDNTCVAAVRGNFGDILAGYFARELGLPVGTLVCASNANNVLTDFIRTGRYDKKRPFYLTSSPSMDILVSSNLERLLFLLSGDEQLVAQLMRQLAEDGAYEVPEELKKKIQSLFWAGCCGDAETKQTIGKVWQEHHYLCDTHTAVAWNVAQQYKAANPAHAPVVVLSTASPYKFPAAVLGGLGEKAEGDEFAVMEQLERLTGVPAPKNLRGLRERPVRHTTVLDREEMLPFVLKKAQEKQWF